MAKKEICWKTRTESGGKQEVRVSHFGEQWTFYVRQGRYEQWRVLDSPSLSEWLTLLDAVSRRAIRHLYRPEDEAQLKKIIQKQFPTADLSADAGKY
jgi:hypothetical protein